MSSVASPGSGTAEPFSALRRRFFRLAALNLLANLSVPLTGLVDTAMLGHLDDIRFLAGVALGALIFETAYFTLGFLRMGTTGTTALAFGAGDHPEVYRVLYRSMVLAFACGGLMVAGQWLLAEGGFALLGGTPEVEAAGRDYFNARIWAAPAAMGNLVFLGWFLGRAESGRVLALSITGNLVNIAFNWLFIIQLGWAARGAGWATVISQTAALALGFAFFFQGSRARLSGDLDQPYRWRWSEILQREPFRALLSLNGDLLIRSILLSGSMALFLAVSSIFGTTLLAASSILQRLFYVASYLIDGVAFAVESLAGHLRGQGENRQLTRLARLSLVTGVAAAGAYLSVLLLASRPILGILTSHGEVIETALVYLPWLALLLPLGGIAFVYDGIYLGLAAGRPLRNSMLISAGLVFLPITAAAALTGRPHLLWAAWILLLVTRIITLSRSDRRELGVVWNRA